MGIKHTKALVVLVQQTDVLEQRSDLIAHRVLVGFLLRHHDDLFSFV